MNEHELFEKLKLELRRGSLVLAVLCQLNEEHYGYSLRHALTEVGLDIDEGTLYPLIRRLESQGLLTSEWREEGNRKKRFYQISTLGLTVRTALITEWQQMNSSIGELIKGDLP